MDELKKKDTVIDYFNVYKKILPAAAPAPVKTVIDRSCYASCKFYGDDPHGPALFKVNALHSLQPAVILLKRELIFLKK